MREDILEFISRRFKDNCHWLDGNCYFFAVILCERFKNLKIYYAPVEGHFVAGDGDLFYDWRGIYKNENPILLEDIQKSDPLWYNILVRDCIK